MSMLYLLFELGADRYALDVRQVVEVLPQVESKAIPGAPIGLVGLMNYRGRPVPLLDLTQLTLRQPCACRMSTRIIVANYCEKAGETRLLGLLAERVTETIRQQESDFRDVAIGGCGNGFYGPVLTDGSLMVQRVQVNDLVSHSMREELFAEMRGRQS
jgi:chemotaxis-related protein WspB